ncbi:hypothetical protein [Conexibacter sp. SYSU D00693]|uniref:hypothetical protein n=1 Tax=Conexibacter sp. SYSU D00693 TaxID=2812560 RepID=UPI00196ADF5F|nr:hypothetical protein [Conexibacter sp. SYSU D00693]
MTPPAGTYAGTRTMPAPAVRRRRSKPAAAPAPSRRRPARPPAAQPTLGARAVARLRALPDAPVLDRLLRGSGWVPLVALGLMGIVFMQVSMLKLNSGIGRAVEASATLERQNDALRSDVSKLESSERLANAARRMGMVVPAAGSFRYVTVRGERTDARAAAKGITTPSPVKPGSSTAAAQAQQPGSQAATTTATTPAAGTTTSTPATTTSTPPATTATQAQGPAPAATPTATPQTAPAAQAPPATPTAPTTAATGAVAAPQG